MGTAALAFLGVRANGMNFGMLGSRLTPPSPFSTVPHPLPLEVVPMEVDEEIDLVDLAIL